VNRISLSAFVILVAALSGSPASGFPKLEQPRTFQTNPQHVDKAIIEALIFLETKVDPYDWPRYQFFEFLDSSDALLEDDTINFRAYLPMVSTGPAVYRPIPIDEAGKVWAVDITRLGWNRLAVQSVTRLDTLCRQPHVNSQLAEELRRALCVDADGTKTPHCEGMLSGNWFVREIQETDRHRDDPENIAYYNLLYAKERFGEFKFVTDKHGRDLTKNADATPTDPGRIPPLPKRKIWQGGVWPGDGHFYPQGAFDYYEESREQIEAIKRAREKWRQDKARFRDYQDTRTQPADRSAHYASPFIKVAEPIDRNFPRNVNDWLDKWGAKAAEDYLAKEKFFKKNGTVIAGFRNNPRGGSIVSYNDRVNEFLNGPLGLVMRTRDFLKTADRRTNPAETPLEVSLGDVQEDASEHIAQKPDDFPAWMLAGAAKAGRKRVEFGDPHAVRNSMDPHNVLVLTMNACIMCHYPADVVLSPSNEKILDSLKRRNELLAYTPEETDVIDQFFHDSSAAKGGWKFKLDNWRSPFARSLAVATSSPAKPKGLSGAEWAILATANRNRYDEPVNLDQACAELGYPRLAVVVALYTLGSIDAQTLFLDAEPGVPRDVWDNDLRPKLAGLLAFARDAEFGDPIILGYFPDLVRDARQQLYTLKKK
jgi:hypothetical protein